MFINLTILNQPINEIVDWLKNEAGVSDKNYFKANFQGGLELQQVPEEYAQLLVFFRESKIKKYMEIGIGNGGSFLVNTCALKDSLIKAIAVDNLSYSQTKEGLEKRFNTAKHFGVNLEFFNSDSVLFLKNCKEKFDCIFIDGDHSYQGVKADFIEAKKLLGPKGYLIFHDIASRNCPGVRQLWQEIKNDKCKEFVASDTCGIGVWQE